jgi:hypothetical protein
MGQTGVSICLLLLLAPLWILLSRDFIKGLCFAVFLCVSMPTQLRIQMPGSLPQLTIYRLVLILVFLFWLRHRDPDRKMSRAPLFGLFGLWGVANLASLFFTSGNFVTSLKYYLDFVGEAAVFFMLLVTSVRRRGDIVRILRAACLGVTLVAALAFVEKYTLFNPVDHFANLKLESVAQDDGGQRPTVRRGRDITGTYQHRILLGTGMAMGWPLVIALHMAGEDWRRKNLRFWLPLALLIASCFFSNSRGPWLASALAGGLLALLGGASIRRRLLILSAMASFVLLLKPGVWQMLSRDVQATSETDSFKGGTFRYRLELWKVAWSRISESPHRFLFGYGPGCGLGSTVEWKLSYRDDRVEEIWSWDCQLAYDLYQSGVVGLAASLALYGGVLLLGFRIWTTAESNERAIMASLLASLLAYVFMLTNVLMFTKPVNFLFWTVAAAALSIGLNPLDEIQADADSAAEANPGHTT